MFEVEYGQWVRCAPGHHVGGDHAHVHLDGTSLLAVIVDVLGHGPSAYAAIAPIEAVVRARPDLPPVALLGAIGDALRHKRGCAAGAARIDLATGVLRYAGVGNTTCRLIRRDGQSRRLVSRDGVLGQGPRSITERSLTVEPGDLLLLFTDGVSDRFGADALRTRSTDRPEHIARIVVDRYGRDHDDAACVALRFQDGGGG